jgi:hypothetical protein
MNGVWVDMPYRPGDVVRTNEFGRDYIVFNPEDEARPDAKKFYQIRYEDVYGLVRREPRYQLSDDYLTAREVNA